MSILDVSLAQKYIDKTAKDFDFNINIMNDKGIIIASKDASRIGDFHEVAYNLLNGTSTTGVVNEERKYIGTKPGVNLFIEHKNKVEGVICVTGNPENVSAFAGLVKSSMEVMLDYEYQMEGSRSWKNKVEQFLYYILFEDDIDMTLANSMAEEMKLNKDVYRVVLIIQCDIDYTAENIIKELRTTKGYSYNDLIAVARNGDIIVVKSVKSSQQDEYNNFRKEIKDYTDYFLEKLPKHYDKDRFRFLVGTRQKSISKYRHSYQHAQKLKLYTKNNRGPSFFDDHILDYFRSNVTMKVYDNIFNVYDDFFNDDDKGMIVKAVEALNRNNYNVVSSSKELFIHRNTLVFRLNKIKSALNIDPISNAKDREFLNELAYYYKNKI
jgi:carbohydrate diacid regulator